MRPASRAKAVGVLSAAGGALAGGVLWTAVVIAVGHQVGYCTGLGVLVGRRRAVVEPAAAAVLALLGCLLGDLLINGYVVGQFTGQGIIGGVWTMLWYLGALYGGLSAGVVLCHLIAVVVAFVLTHRIEAATPSGAG